MPHNDLSPISVTKYSKDFLIDLVRYKTGWDQRNEVSDKTQLTYLCSYLEVDHIAAKTIVVESEYVDRHYLEDYAEYYARCFASHPRKCTRVHFFSIDFDEYDFTDALAKNETKFIQKLSENYIGFAVIRPIPHTFLAKVCIKPYAALLENQEYKLITKEHCVSLFGLSLKVRTAAFLEQDKVVSACATSALWMLYSSSFQKPHEHLPSPSAITKSASLPASGSGRTFPTTGLTPLQVAKSLKHFDLEPIIIHCGSDGEFVALKEAVYSYISNDIPVIIGGDVYQKAKSGETKYIGKHLVCALGFHLKEVKSDKKINLKYRSHGIDKIYVHDDRYGPFVRIDAEPIYFSSSNENKNGLGFYLKKIDSDGSEVLERTDYFVPEIVIVGLYHKVRVPYDDIRDICTALYFYLYNMRNSFTKLSKEVTDDPDKKLYSKDIGALLRKIISGLWDISLTTNTSIKTELLLGETFASFNGGTNKENLLLLSMPRYIWRCRVWIMLDAKPVMFTDILFDATEVPQGRVLIGYISYLEDAEKIWKHIEQNSKDRTWMGYGLSDDVKNNLSSLWKFFSKSKEKTYLNTLYGPLGLPRRELKNGEEDIHHNIKLRNDVSIIRRGSVTDWKFLDKGKKYIWVVNEHGDLVLGEDIFNQHGYQGHPTLVDSKPARLGGELHWSSKEKIWITNLRSRAYSSHIKESTAQETTYLDNINTKNFVGLDSKGVSKSYVIS